MIKYRYLSINLISPSSTTSRLLNFSWHPTSERALFEIQTCFIYGLQTLAYKASTPLTYSVKSQQRPTHSVGLITGSSARRDIHQWWQSSSLFGYYSGSHSLLCSSKLFAMSSGVVSPQWHCLYPHCVAFYFLFLPSWWILTTNWKIFSTWICKPAACCFTCNSTPFFSQPSLCRRGAHYLLVRWHGVCSSHRRW